MLAYYSVTRFSQLELLKQQREQQAMFFLFSLAVTDEWESPPLNKNHLAILLQQLLNYNEVDNRVEGGLFIVILGAKEAALPSTGTSMCRVAC